MSTNAARLSTAVWQAFPVFRLLSRGVAEPNRHSGESELRPVFHADEVHFQKRRGSGEERGIHIHPDRPKGHALTRSCVVVEAYLSLCAPEAEVRGALKGCRRTQHYDGALFLYGARSRRRHNDLSARAAYAHESCQDRGGFSAAKASLGTEVALGISLQESQRGTFLHAFGIPRVYLRFVRKAAPQAGRDR